MPRTRSHTALYGGIEAGVSEVQSAVLRPHQPRKRSKGGKGRLETLLDLPLNVLTKVFCALHPQDLLQLSRTTKALRGLLTSRHSAFIWKTSLQHETQLPPCPSYMNEMQYINLAFSAHCHECLKPNIRTILWEFGVRYCPGCKTTKTIVRDADGTLPGAEELSVDWVLCIAHGRASKVLCHVSEIEHVCRIWETIKHNNEDVGRFAREQRARIDQITEWADQCYDWEELRSVEIKSYRPDHGARREERLQSVIQRIRALGEFDKEIDFMQPSGFAALLKESMVRKPSRLTDNGWNGMRDRIIEILHQQKTLRLRAEKKAVLEDRFAALCSFVRSCTGPGIRTPASKLCPKPVDFAVMPEFLSLMDAPSDIRVTERSFEHLRPAFSSLQTRWDNNIKERLQPYLPGVESMGNEGMLPTLDERLHLATTVFACRTCDEGRKLLWWPWLKAHPCLREGGVPGSEYETLLGEIAEMCPLQIEHGIVATLVRDSGQARAQARNLVEMFALDPDSATCADMDETQRHIYCRACTKPGRTLAMTWRGAMEHAYYWLWKPHPGSRIWSLPSFEEELMIEQTLHDLGRDPMQYKTWCCAYCDDDCGPEENINSVKQHLWLKHAIWYADTKKGDLYGHPGVIGLDRKPLYLCDRAVPVETVSRQEMVTWKDADKADWDVQSTVERILTWSAQIED
ncbi:hypothetical protein OBBRIDRAFT_774940 [Obba rivulosa]|uniref:F-box domain-containing protein n=1 Tax=Obba rivulosa TaxID=1052685 RepID=A0A8E2B0A2_9APHY|nr:hypothetical protein OBBRIDRAFT_774940 [Obba rivulosa]